MSEDVVVEGKIVPKFPGCVLRLVVDADGKRHIEADCQSKKDGHELADLLEQEVIIRVKPAKVTEMP